MANELQAQYTPGSTLTVQLMNGATAVGGAIALTETSTAGYYTGAMPGSVAAGGYVVLLLAGGAVVGSGTLRWDGTAEVLPAAASSVPTANTVAAAVRAAIDASAVAANLTHVLGGALTGDGTESNPWGPAA